MMALASQPVFGEDNLSGHGQGYENILNLKRALRLVCERTDERCSTCEGCPGYRPLCRRLRRYRRSSNNRGPVTNSAANRVSINQPLFDGFQDP